MKFFEGGTAILLTYEGKGAEVDEVPELSAPLMLECGDDWRVSGENGPISPLKKSCPHDFHPRA